MPSETRRMRGKTLKLPSSVCPLGRQLPPCRKCRSRCALLAPTARLRKFRQAFICHWQRLWRNSPSRGKALKRTGGRQCGGALEESPRPDGHPPLQGGLCGQPVGLNSFISTESRCLLNYFAIYSTNLLPYAIFRQMVSGFSIVLLRGQERRVCHAQ